MNLKVLALVRGIESFVGETFPKSVSPENLCQSYRGLSTVCLGIAITVLKN